MQPFELTNVVLQARVSQETLGRLLDVLELFAEDIELARHSHDTFLPAARDYLRHRRDADYRLKNARIRRARLGGASRWLYYHQRKTFEKVLKLLCPIPLPPGLVDWAWQIIRAAESDLLRKSRADAKSRHPR